MTSEEIIRFIRSKRLPLHNEKAAQAALAAEFEASGLVVEREKRLSAEDIVDFFVDGIAIEMKLKGQRMAIYRQCERYCEHDSVHELILVTNAAMGLPKEILGRPAYLINLGMAWL